MSENGMDAIVFNGGDHHDKSGRANGYHDSKEHRHHSSKHKHKDKDRERRKETEEERRIRKEKERRERPKETEEERKMRKERERKEREERHRREGKREETEEERRIRKEKERRERSKETEEERKIRKERERKEKEERHRREGKKEETEEERRIRKEKERKERDERHRHKDRKETEEERRERKERERQERKERERKERELAERQRVKEEIKDEPMEEDDDTEENGQEESEEENPLARNSKKRKSYKEEDEDFEPEDEEPVRQRSKKIKKEESYDEEEEEVKPVKKSKPPKKAVKKEPVSPTKKAGRKKKEEEQAEVWKWWEEDKKADDGTKWYFLEHRGPLFAPQYEPLPKHVKFRYNKQSMKLTPDTEEVATFYGRMIEHDYTTKEVFNKNFFKDWRKVMTPQEKEVITDLSKCDFTEINAYFKEQSEKRKNRSKEEKKAEKEKNEEIQKEYGVCTIDGHKEKIGNFRIEPPGLFRGRGEHPKQGMLKKRVMPEDVIINCSKDSDWPKPPKGHKWKKVQHDNTVTWLASWTENIQNQIKYVMLNPASKLKGEKDMMKYEKARQLKKHIGKIREDYIADFKSKEMRLRQRAVALYFIDKLALRAGNEKDEDQADTVGCCSLRVEHITLHPEKEFTNDDGDVEVKEFVVEFDFLGKDSIRYNNSVAVEKRVYKNVQLFMENKKDGDDLFDRLNTSILNEYLNGLMPGLTAKVFRTYNASITLQEQLEILTDEDAPVPKKILQYNRANREVAILCNHQRAVPKTHEKSMANLQAKIDAKEEAISKAEKEFKAAKKAYKNSGNASNKANLEKKKKAVERLYEQHEKLKIQKTDKKEGATIALGTSKLNYLDPRISVAWSKKHDVPVEKVYNKTQREKFRWAIDMAGPDYEF